MKVYPHLTICPYCDSVYRYRKLAVGESARCERCRTVLYHAERLNIERMLALTLTALIAFFIANFYPIITASLHATQNSATLWQASFALARGSTLPMAICMLFLLIIIPLLQITLFGWLLIYALRGLRAPGFTYVMKWLIWLRPWNMLEVGMLGFLVSAIKLSDLVHIIPGAGCWAMAALMLLLTILNHHDIRALWALAPLPAEEKTVVMDSPDDARRGRLRACPICDLVCEPGRADGATPRCPRCRARLHRRRPDALQRAWALLIAAVIFYIPANTLPVMYTGFFGQGGASTIMSGVIDFWRSGSYGIALLIFTASVVIPCMKFLALGLLLIAAQRRSAWAMAERTTLYRFTEFIGYWSMLDVVVVACVSALVQFQALSEAQPRSGILFFGLVVILTMLSAMSYDPRLTWEGDDQ